MSSDLSNQNVASIASAFQRNLLLLPASEKGNEQLDRLPVDLTDVRTICIEVREAIDKLLIEENWKDPDLLREILESIQGSFYVHLKNHYKSLRVGIEEVLDRVPDPRSEEEILDSMVNQVNEFLAKLPKKSDKLE